MEISDQGIRWVGRGSEATEISWPDLAEIRIVTNGNGPFVEDVFFGFIASVSNFLILPQSDIDEEVLPRLQPLPGFDNSALIETMSSVTDAQFVVWRASPYS